MTSISAAATNASEISLHPTAERSDILLLSLARRGNSSAFGELCKRHEKRLFHITLRITRNREDAEDAIQECYLNALVHLKDFDGRSQFATWLTRIAINTALMKIRRSRKFPELPLQSTDEFGEVRESIHLVDRSLNPEEGYAEGEKVKILREAVSALRPRIRAAIEIRQLQECSMNETARKLGISQAATKGRLFQARATLRRSWRVRAIGVPRIQRAA